MDSERLRRNILRLQGLVRLVEAWTSEAELRIEAHDPTGAMAALKGLDTFSAEITNLYRDCLEITAMDQRHLPGEGDL